MKADKTREPQEIHVRFTIDAAAWGMFKSACLIDGRDRYDQLRKIIRKWTRERVRLVPAKRGGRREG